VHIFYIGGDNPDELLRLWDVFLYQLQVDVAIEKKFVHAAESLNRLNNFCTMVLFAAFR
jgi:hypothetical protein